LGRKFEGTQLLSRNFDPKKIMVGIPFLEALVYFGWPVRKKPGITYGDTMSLGIICKKPGSYHDFHATIKNEF